MPEEIHRDDGTEAGVLRTRVEEHERVVVAFRADWSDRCRQLERKLSAVEGTRLLVVDVDENPVLAYEYDVTQIPTLLRLEGDEVVDRTEGVPDDLDAFLRDETAR